MATTFSPGPGSAGPLRGELRYGFELARLLADREFLRPRRSAAHPPVLLIPGFMAGDQSLEVLGGWLRRRGAQTARAGILVNVGCAERIVENVEERVRRLAARAGARVVLIGQSRGGGLARAVAVRNPELVGGVIMLGSPVLAPLDVGPGVMRAVRSVALLGDLGLPGMFSTECGEGPCCERFRDDVLAPLPDGVRAWSIYSRSDGIVSWRACLDPHADHIEVGSSHTGMSVNARVYAELARIFDEEPAWTG